MSEIVLESILLEPEQEELLATVVEAARNTPREARRMLRHSGGGELTTKGKGGKIRSKDTIHPGHEPTPPKDTEH